MIELGFTEHKDGFNVENIPSNILDRSFHTSYGGFTGISKSQATQASDVAITLRVFFKGFKEVLDKTDQAVDACEEIIAACVTNENVLERMNLKITNADFESLDIEQLATTNDNSFICTIVFVLRVNFCISE